MCTPHRTTVGRSTSGLRSTLLALVLLAFCAAAAHALEDGDPAPRFSAPSLTGGGNVSLADHRGKVVYVDFWASWCGPCLKSLPLLEELQQEFGADAFQVVGVNLDQDPAKGRRFLRKISVSYPSAMDPKGAIPETFGLETMPTSYLLDRDGVIRHVHKGFRKSDLPGLREKIAALVKESR